MNEMMFGKLTMDSVPWHEPVAMGGVAGMVLAAIMVLGGVTFFKKWGYLYREWLTSVDHKRLGVMYIVLALVMLLRRLLSTPSMMHRSGTSPPAATTAFRCLSTTTRSSWRTA